MQKERDASPLSLSQRGYLIAKSLDHFRRLSRALIAFNSFFLALGWIMLYYQVVDILVLVILELSLATGYSAITYFFNARRSSRRLKQWNEDYLEEAYVLVFDTTVPKGKTTGEKILNLAGMIFPELRPDYVDFLSWDDSDRLKVYFKRRFGKSEEQNILDSFNHKIDSYSLDLALRTLSGYFIVKDFGDKVVTLEDLKQLIEVVRRKFKDKYQRTFVYRVICVAKKYDQPFLQRESLEHYMAKSLRTNFKVDLLVEEKVGYSVLWIS